MGRFKYDEADKYGGSGGNGYFSLKDDGDTAKVRFMYDSVDDVEGYSVHQVEIDGKKRFINCKRTYNEPIENCPFCAAKQFQLAKLFIPIYNVEEDRVQTWERGKKYFQKMSSLCARYGSENPLVEQVFEIERNGKAGSTQTTYEIYPIGKPDGTTFDDLPDKPVITDGIVLDKSVEDMQYYLDNGVFPSDDDGAVRRRSDNRRASTDDNRRRPDTRRTPREVF